MALSESSESHENVLSVIVTATSHSIKESEMLYMHDKPMINLTYLKLVQAANL